MYLNIFLFQNIFYVCVLPHMNADPLWLDTMPCAMPLHDRTTPSTTEIYAHGDLAFGIISNGITTIVN